MYQYHLKLIPISYVFLDSTRNIFSHLFSVTTYQKDISQGASGLPGFFVQYEFSPLMIKYEERRQYVLDVHETKFTNLDVHETFMF